VSGFGVRTAYGTLERVIVHRPGRELDKVTPDTLREFHFARPADRHRFVAEYDAMLGLLRRHGVETLLLSEILAGDEDALGYMAHRPNMTYTRDLAAVFSRGAVLMGPHLWSGAGSPASPSRSTSAGADTSTSWSPSVRAGRWALRERPGWGRRWPATGSSWPRLPPTSFSRAGAGAHCLTCPLLVR
jgi:hypothetical protein